MGSTGGGVLLGHLCVQEGHLCLTMLYIQRVCAEDPKQLRGEVGRVSNLRDNAAGLGQLRQKFGAHRFGWTGLPMFPSDESFCYDHCSTSPSCSLLWGDVWGMGTLPLRVQLVHVRKRKGGLGTEWARALGCVLSGSFLEPKGCP